MTDPVRLKHLRPGTLSQRLLESATSERSTPGASGRALGALGLGVTTLGVTAKASATAVSSSHWIGTTIAKWLGIGLLGGVTALEGGRAVSEAFSNAPPATVPRTTEVRPSEPKPRATPPSPSAVAEPEPEPDPELAPIASARVTPKSAALPGAALEEPRSGDAGLSDSLLALRGVRDALAAGAPRRALELLDAFERHSPGSPLAEEAAVLRIDAATALRSNSAAALGEQFFQRYPRSAYRERVRSLLRRP